jgi:IS30 family transposase
MIIELLLANKRSHRWIARVLGRDRRVIDREVKRNKPEGRPYTARLAMELTARREATRSLKKIEKDKPHVNLL